MPVWEFLKPPAKDFIKDCFVRVAAPVVRPKKVAENEPKKSAKKRKPPAK